MSTSSATSTTPPPAQAEPSILHPTPCAICGTMGNAEELYPANFSEDDFNPRIFSARRLPDQIHYRMVRCRECRLVRSDPVVDSDILNALYAKSTFDYNREVQSLKATYGAYLDRARKWAKPDVQNLLEVGGGNGFFLEEALRRGVKNVRGVEPSSAAIEKAAPEVRDRLVCDVMRPGLFAEGEFDLVCLFQVFDHISDPVTLLKECLRVLRPGGLILAYNHNVEATSARLMGEKSPIIDIEHTYLYSPQTMRAIYEKCGFECLESGPGWNRLSLSHLTHLLPLPRFLKRPALSVLEATRLGRIVGRLPLGNLFLIARRPAS